MKYFFDIDPVLTETVMEQAFTHSQLIRSELRYTIRTNMQQRKTKLIDLLHQESSPSWTAA
jgi:hypothetical protein